MSVAAIAMGMTVATPALAQQADVNSYLCTFAGKCGATADQAEAVTKAAPATKGFRLATAQAQEPTMAAPATKSFRLATGHAQDAAQPSTPAPATKSFRLARSTPQPAGVNAARSASSSPARRYAAARPAPVVVATPGTARANLMLTFQLNSDHMTPAATLKAKTFAQALMMAELKDKRFLIEGHTDARGARDVNIDLSRRRAQSVADFLVAQGVDRNRVEVKGVGPDEPLPGESAKAESNRRVEAVLLS